MKAEIKSEMVIPEGVTVNVADTLVTVRGPKGEDSREYSYPGVGIVADGGKVTLSCSNASKREKRILSTFLAHVKNMLRGVRTPFEYKLKICSGHFPMNVSVSGNKLVVKNFLGEKHPRECSFVEGVSVKVSGTEVKVTGVSREKVGLVTGRIEQLCRITNKDRRIFQDGIYIVKKPGRDLS